MKKAVWISALALLWLILVIRNIPAQWGLSLAGASLQAEGISGTVWSGRAANVVLPFQNQRYALGKLEWKLSPWSLLLLKPCLELSSEYQSQSLQGEACVGLGGSSEFNNVVVKLPADIIKLWLPVDGVRGNLLFRVDTLEMEGERIVKLSGKGRWDDAYYHNSFDWMKLGAVAFDFRESPDGGVLTEVVDIDGPLKLDLLYQFSLQGTFQLKGDVIVQPNAPKELVQVLTAVADEKGANHFYIDWGGS